jgi:4-diphosphocytidyl-2-C-methyl-D-erythritol kinase
MTDWLEVAIEGRNDLEGPARAIAPVIGAVTDLFAAQPGVTLARMSGSGATCFALFDSEAARTAAAQAIRSAQPDWWCLESTLA